MSFGLQKQNNYNLSSQSFFSQATSQSLIDSRILKKLIIFGSYNVGKTSFLSRYHIDHFSQQKFQQSNMEGLKKFIEYNKQKIELEIKDTQPYDYYFHMVPQTHSYQISGYILMYSVEDKNSFLILKDIREKLFEMNGYHLPQILVGNKSDSSNRVVSFSEGSILADKWQIPFLEISCKRDKQEKSNEIITELMQEVYEKEFPNQKKNALCQVRKMKASTRKLFMYSFVVINCLLILLGIAFIIYGIYYQVQTSQFKQFYELWSLLSIVVEIIASCMGMLGVRKRREDLIMAFIVLSFIEIGLEVLSYCTIELTSSNQEIETANTNQLAVLIAAMTIKVMLLVITPILYKIIKIEKHIYIVNKQEMQRSNFSDE